MEQLADGPCPKQVKIFRQRPAYVDGKAARPDTGGAQRRLAHAGAELPPRTT